MNVIDLIANSPSFSHTHLHYTTPADSSRRNPSVRSCLVSIFLFGLTYPIDLTAVPF